MQYRGAPEEWSNTYDFTGTLPTSDTDWKALAVAVYTTEKTILKPSCELVRAYGYRPDSNVSVAQIDFTVGTPLTPDGTLTIASAEREFSGDQAATVRAQIGVSSTGKKVYIRKYYHAGGLGSGTPDVIVTAMQTAMATHFNTLLAGSLPGGSTLCGPAGQTPFNVLASPLVTTRTLKRRGKRP